MDVACRSRSQKNPRRVAAGRANGRKRRPWADEDRRRLREQCLKRQPWLWSTGPTSEQGKLRSADNGHCHRPDPNSLRQLRVSLADVRGMAARMDGICRSLGQ